MANLTEPEILFDSGSSDGQQESSLDSALTPAKPLYSTEEIVNFTQIALYSLGFLTNILILVVFFKQGLRNSSTNIGFFSLALADLFVCVVYITDLTAQVILNWWFHLMYFWRMFIFKEVGTEISAWTTAVICWERLGCIMLPEKLTRHITPKVTVIALLVYFLLLVLDLIVWFLADEAINHIFNDPCASYYDYYEYNWVSSITSETLMDLAYEVRHYVSLIFTTVPNVIVFVMLVVGAVVFGVVLKRRADLRKPLKADKDLVDSAKFTRLTLVIFAVCVKYIVTSGPRTIDKMLTDFSVKFDTSGFYKYFVHASFILLAINHSTNIFLYLVINSKFRKEFRNIFCSKCIKS